MSWTNGDYSENKNSGFALNKNSGFAPNSNSQEFIFLRKKKSVGSGFPSNSKGNGFGQQNSKKGFGFGQPNSKGFGFGDRRNNDSFGSSRKPTTVDCMLVNTSTGETFGLTMNGPSKGRVASKDPAKIDGTLSAVDWYNKEHPECPLSIRC